VKRWLLLLPLLILVACSKQQAYVTTVGILKPGATLTVHVADATLNAYQPAAGQRRDFFTVAATALKGTPPPAPRLHVGANGVVVEAPNSLASLMVRVPDVANLQVESRRGDVNVTGIAGDAQIAAEHGNVQLILPTGYAQAAVGQGNLSVTMGSTNWPGTLRFSTRRGDIEVWINPKTSFDVHLHTDDGSLFTDFALTGSSHGRSETIDGSVNGRGLRRIDVETSSGAIRLLRLQPQA
jgi:Putative adhesin